MPTLYLQAESGLAQDSAVMEHAKNHIINLQAEIIPGSHHFHMEGDVAAIANRIGRFLQDQP
ncbi:MAG: hypothetical protein IMF06_02655 [Proteobacteria bacterium]|nr:hypothetical protein [Pseudomonadota bacterium]